MHAVHTGLLLLYSPNQDQDQYVKAATIQGMILGCFKKQVQLVREIAEIKSPQSSEVINVSVAVLL